jgi:hypothetical protein
MIVTGLELVLGSTVIDIWQHVCTTYYDFSCRNMITV